MKNKEAKSVFSSLENFSSIPPPELWDNIEAQLEKPKKKRRAIIWWSVAASLVVGILVPSILYFNSNQGNTFELNQENTIVLEKGTDQKKNVPIEEEGKEIIKSHDNKENSATKKVENAISNTNNSVASQNNSAVPSKTKKQIRLKSTNQAVVSTDVKQQSNTPDKNKARTSVYQPKSSVAVNNSFQGSNSNGNIKSSANNENTTVPNLNKNNQVAEIAVSKSIVEKNNSQSNSALKGNSESKTTNSNAENSGSNRGNEIAQNTNQKDSLATIKKEVAQLETALANLDKDKTKKKIDAKDTDKWSLQVFAGVMSSENYSNEKALGNTVESKQSNGYGVKTNYKLNKKWTVSSGFKINELGQKIAGVSYYEQQAGLMGALPASPVVSNVDAFSSKNSTEIVSISSNDNYLFASNPTANSSKSLATGNVTQNLKYFEMPLEVSYSLLNKKKTSINMNTGGFVGKLISNEVLLNGSSIGENKNVNEYVYGTLLSSTLQYEFLKKTKFFIEPGMNYYINPLENQSFNQFQWMFNIGLNVSF